MIFNFLVYLVLDGGAVYFRERNLLETASKWNFLRGDIWMDRYNKASHPEERLFFLEQALRWEEQNPFYWNTAARFLQVYFPRDHSKITNAYRKTTVLAPHHAPFWVQWGLYEAQRKNYTEAKSYLKESIRLEPNSSFPYAVMGEILRQEQKFISAEGFGNKAKVNQNIGARDVPPSPYSDFMFSPVNL